MYLYHLGVNGSGGIASIEATHRALSEPGYVSRTGSYIVALGTTVQISKLPDDRLKRLQALEGEMGLVLLACESSG